MNKRDYILINAVANGCAIIFEGEEGELKEENDGGVDPSLDFDATDTPDDSTKETEGSGEPSEEADPGQEPYENAEQPSEEQPAEPEPEQEPAQVADEVNPGDPETVNSESVKTERMNGQEIAQWYVDQGYFINLMKFIQSHRLLESQPGMNINPVRYKKYLEGSLTKLFTAGKINCDPKQLAVAELIIEHSIPAMFDMIRNGEAPHIPTKEQPKQEPPKEEPKPEEPTQQAEAPAPEANEEKAPEQSQENEK